MAERRELDDALTFGDRMTFSDIDTGSDEFARNAATMRALVADLHDKLAAAMQGGSEEASIEDWCAYMSRLVGVEAKLAPSEHALESVRIDTTRMHELIGRTSVPWHDGIRRMVAARHPEITLRG